MRSFTLALALMLTPALACAKAGDGKGKSAKAGGNPHVILETNLGTMEVELYADKAPISTKNFLAYADEGYYTGTIFHRIIPTFMIQGGGFSKTMQKKPTKAPIKNEADNGVSNARGTLAMARTGVVDSATAQFFINVVDNARLDHRSKDARGYGYAVFGKVVSGMDVVDKIRNVITKCPSSSRAPCNEGLPPGMRDVPATPVEILSVKRKG